MGIDVGREPPMVLAEGPWVEGCERVGETLRVEVAKDAPDLRFDFVGLPEGAEVGYEAFDAAGAPLGGGMGMWVPLSRWEGVRTVAFYGVDGADFSAVRRVSSRVDGGQAAGGTGTKAGLAAARAGSGDGFVVRVIPGEGVAKLETSEPEAVVAGMSMENPIRTVSSLKDVLVNSDELEEAPGYGKWQFKLSVEGELLVPSGTRFQAGADDTARVTIGGCVSAGGGEAADGAVQRGSDG